MINKVYVIVAAVVLAVVVGTGLYVTSLKRQIVELNNEKVELSLRLKTQNDAIAALKRDSDARIEAGAKALAEAKAQADQHRGRAQVIYKTRPSSGDDCHSALDLINGGMK